MNDTLEENDVDIDIHELFMYYNALYFRSTLESRVTVEWSSSRMTSCGGTCQLLPGGGIIIRLSKPLLCLRPISDLKNVLLHEMIHAYMFVHSIRDDDAGGHGTAFKAMMKEINASCKPDAFRPMPGGYKITVYHTMSDEVEYYKKHRWECFRCGDMVKRAVNRKPQQADCRWYASRNIEERRIDCGDVTCRWHMHQKYCGGEYVKTQGGDRDTSQKPESMTKTDTVDGMYTLDKMFRKEYLLRNQDFHSSEDDLRGENNDCAREKCVECVDLTMWDASPDIQVPDFEDDVVDLTGG